MTTELQPFAGSFAVLGPEAEEYLDILEENTGSRQIDLGSLPVWRFPGSGSDEWVYEDAAGGRHKEASLRGVVLGQRPDRTMYLSKYSGGGEPPDCQSVGNEWGSPRVDESGLVVNTFLATDGREVAFGGDCLSCPLGQWDSAALVPGKDGGGKACAEYRFLIIQRPDSPTPEGVRLPPTALKGWRAFGEQMSQARARLSRTLVEFSLAIPKGGSLAQLEVTALAVIPAETSAQLKSVAPSVNRRQLASPLSPENEAAVAESQPF